MKPQIHAASLALAAWLCTDAGAPSAREPIPQVF
jgi:hypothetical protein